MTTHGWTLSSSEEDSDSSENDSVGSDISSTPVDFLPDDGDKPECPYGEKCHRENPVHFQEFSHPLKRKATDETVGVTGKSEGSYSGYPPAKKKRLDEPGSRICKDPVAVWKASSPYYFLLTTCKGISEEFNYFNQKAREEKFIPPSLGIREILSEDHGTLQRSAQFNYCIDIEWLMEQYPKNVRDKPLLIVHGQQRQSGAALQAEAKRFPNIKLCQVDLPPYGTHHTKMMLLLYEEGLRIVISTANLVPQDWSQKTQGFWMSPVFPPLERSTATDCEFKRDLIFYLTSYKKKLLKDWIQIIEGYDFSSANVVLIASTPGRHTGAALSHWGHMRLRKVLRSKIRRVDSSWPVIGQFSSIGSLGANENKWLCGEWLTSLASSNPGTFAGRVSNLPPLKLVFPTVENVRRSLEGYPAGASVPYSSANATKQKWLNSYMHQWNADNTGRSEASPHIKSYTRISPYETNVRAAWFLLTSANLSKAAWGGLEKNATQLAIRSYELGVLFIPPTTQEDVNPHAGAANNTDMIPDSYFHLKTHVKTKCSFFVPFHLPLTRYSSSDMPWTWDAPHTDAPDRHGNIWVPS
ncbi:unnamed protein product [Clavelina lepadiformis]|uniref:PBZ-type domain-containing protein n=1 Tax=Clavelina lepadiformis TaxID=159417 RepID=A0ABP0GIP5_CLALP